MVEAEVTLPDGRKAVVKGPTREAVLKRVEALKAEQTAPEGTQVAEKGQARPESILPASVSEFASAANRGITEGIDFLTTGAVNAASKMAGSDFRVPTLTGAAQSIGVGQRGFMEPGLARDATQAAGQYAPALVSVVGAAKGIPSLLSSQSPARQTAERLFRDGAGAIVNKAKIMAGDVDMAAKTVSESGRIVRDTLAKNAIKQGFDEGVVASIKASTPETRQNMRKMVDILEGGKKNTLFSVRNRPSDVVGDAIQRRITDVRKVNKEAGMRLNHEAKRLKGQQVDISDAKNAFLDALEELKVSIDDAGELVFKGSNVEGTSSPRSLKLIYNRLKNFDGDALEAHHIKQFISEHVEFGKKAQTSGLTGKAEKAAKALRHELNTALNGISEGYAKQNSIYAETIDALKSFEKSAGQSLDILAPNAEKAIGTAARKLMSNQQSRVAMLNSIDDLDKLVAKHGVKAKDDILALALFADELDAVFKPVARTSLAGDVAKATNPVKEVPTTTYEAVVKAGEYAAGKIRNVNEQEALRSIRSLLDR